MKHLLYILIFASSIGFSQTVEYPITCHKKTLGENHASYIFIISVKKIYFYNFTDHMVSDNQFKDMFWKKSSTMPIDTSGFEMICNTKIREDQISERLKTEIKKLQ